MVQTAERHPTKTQPETRNESFVGRKTTPKKDADKQKASASPWHWGLSKEFPETFEESSQPHSGRRAMEDDLGLDNNLEVFAGMIKGKTYLPERCMFIGCCELA